MPRQTTCTEYALYYINRFPKTEQELRIQLIKKWYHESDIDQTMSFLKSKHYIDDRTFTKLYIDSELIRKGKVAIWVRQKLLQKWVDKTIVYELMEQYQDDIQSGINQRLSKEITQYKQKWYQGVQIVQKLMRKWYSYRDIKHYIQDQWSSEINHDT